MTMRAVALLGVLTCGWAANADWQRESLGRGLVAVSSAGSGVFLSWRLLDEDPIGVAFNLYRTRGDAPPELVNAKPITGATNFVDADAASIEGLAYQLRAVVDSHESAVCGEAAVWKQGFLEIPFDRIEGYRAGDGSVADLDGDGELELVLHQVSRGRDNGSAGLTGEPVLDAYELDGARLWRINLGKNIREGEHYTQFVVYDLDGDGAAEVACKTADGTVDGVGDAIGDATRDWRTFAPDSPRHGRVLDGPEYFTVFDGRTGAALATQDYLPSRDPIDGWGGIGGNAGNDRYGNRCDRFLACVAYLDGRRPSVVMCRGVYGRTALTAWDWRDGELKVRWRFDTGPSYPPYDNVSPYAGMGGHSLSVGDIDHDGRDEVVYQAMVVDDDGKGLYSTGLRHGDAMFLTDIDPDRPGQEVFTVQENEERAELFQTPAAALRDARTGEVLWSHSPTVDAPMGMAADIDPTHRGMELWGGPGGLRNAAGESIGPAPPARWALWWDGDPQRELLVCGRPGLPPRPPRDGNADRPWRRPSRPSPTRVLKWNWREQREDDLYTCEAVAMGVPVLVGDLLGDWREEMLLVAPDGETLRLHTTTIPTNLRLTTLLADRQYRLGLVWQNVAYNKPPQLSFLLGERAATVAPQDEGPDAPVEPGQVDTDQRAAHRIPKTVGR